MSHTIRPRTPAQLAASQKLKQDRAARVAAQRGAIHTQALEDKARDDAERLSRGLKPLNRSDTAGPKFVNTWVAPVRAVVYAPVLPGSRLLDRESIATFGDTDEVVNVLHEYARHFFCGGLTENSDYSISPEGVHIRSDLWPEMQRRADVERARSAASFAKFQRTHKAKSATTRPR